MIQAVPLTAIRIVLVEPSHPGNIGAVARAMKNMALSELVLVRPKAFPHPEASARASGADDLQQDFLNEVGGAASVQTLVFHSRDAASDTKVLNILRNADGIFIGGGDQANYVRYFKGTPVNTLLDEHVRAGKPLGGTSAGLAILGAYSYGAMDGGSLLSASALKNPLGSEVTLVRDFLHLPYLGNVITDSHFAIRERFGRLLVWVGRLALEEKNPAITGIGIDEKAAKEVKRWAVKALVRAAMRK